MSPKNVNENALWAWLLAAMSAPVAQIAGKGPWLGVLALAIVCGGLCWGIHTITGERPAMRPWYCALEFLFLILISGKFARIASSCWPTGNSFPTVSLTLLILAAFSALDGADRASRIGSVLFWLLALLYAVILGAGVKDLHTNWLAPTLEAPRALLAVVFLIPAAAGFLPRQKGKQYKAALMIVCVFAVLIAILTAGTMSPAAVYFLQDPFYEYSKSLSLFGVAERFEAVVSVALTLGYFALLSFLLSAAGHLAEAIHQRWGRAGVLCCAVGAAIIMPICPAVPEMWLALLALLLWGILPLVTQWTAKKRSKNLKKGLDN